MISFDAFGDEFEKIAARAGLKIIRKLINAGEVDKASALAKTPGVLTSRFGPSGNPLGHQIKRLSHGPSKEGIVNATASPDLGISSTKIPYEHGAATPSSISARNLAQNTPHPAAVRVKAVDHVEGLKSPIVHSDYVHGKTIGQYGKAMRAKGMSEKTIEENIDKAKKSAYDFSSEVRKKHGLDVTDLHHDNIMIDHTGQGRVVDPMVARPGISNVQEGAAKNLGKGISPKTGIRDVMKRMGEHGFERKQKGPPPKPTATKEAPPPF